MIARYSGSLLLAIGVTFGLFFMMQALIATGHKAIVDAPEQVQINFAPEHHDEKTQTQQQKLPDKPEMQKAPDVPQMAQARVDPGAVQVNINPDVNSNTTISKNIDFGAAPADGDVLPLVRVPPQYPRIALERGIEGYATCEFDITPEGTTENIHVIDAMPQGIFDRAAMQAVSKFKYKPKIVNGQPTEQTGARFRVTFTLSDNG